MKKIILTSLAVFVSLNLFSQGTYFRQIGIKEAIEAAKKENKAVFIDIYTSWCGPCKNMSENIFPQKEVGDIFNANFVCVKFDAEQTEDGKTIAKTFKVNAYPTFLFLNPEEELIYKFLGGRDVPGITKEAENAVRAFANYPNIKKMTAEYDAGNRSKEFLNDYYVTMSEVGLDCGGILLDYFRLLSDDEILQSDIYGRIEKITVFDEPLADRLINIAIDRWKAGDMDDKAFAALNRSIAKFLGNCLTATSQNDDPADFDKVLELKERLFTIDSNRNSIFAASMGGGNIYVPSEINAMDYYYKKKLTDKFVAVYEKFMEMLINDYDKNRSNREQMGKAMAEKMEEAVKNGDTETINALKKSAGMLSMLQGIDAHYNVVSLINNAEKYAELYKDVKDKAFEDRMTSNYIYLNEYYPSCKNGFFIAEKLMEMERPDAARQVLELVLERGTTAVEVNEEHIDKCKQLLERI